MAEIASGVVFADGSTSVTSHDITSVTKGGVGVYVIVLDTDRAAAAVKCMMTAIAATPVIVTYQITQLAVPPADIAGITVYTWTTTGVAVDAAFSLVVDLET
jgi:hypothetical protein